MVLAMHGRKGGPRSVGLLVCALLGAASFGCYRIPEGQSAIASVDVEGTDELDVDELEGKIVTRKTPKFLGLFYGFIYDYELFDRFALRRDLERIERWMRARGHYEAKVHVARVVNSGDKVHVSIEVEEGPAIKIESIEVVPAPEPRFAGNDDLLTSEMRRHVMRRIEDQIAVGKVLDEDKLAGAEKNVVKALTGRGHAAAKITRRVEVDLATHSAKVWFEVDAGPVMKFGKVTFEGLGELPEDVVRHVFGVEEGARYSSDDLDDGRQALLDLGAFSTIDPEPDLTHCEDTRVVPVKVKAEVSKLRSLMLGGGVEFDYLKTDVHALLGWRYSNFLGGLRRLEVRDSPGIVLFPTRLPKVETPEKPLIENKIWATLKQPAFLERKTLGVSRAEYSIYPVLLVDQGDNVVGYHELRGTVGLERWFSKLFANPQYVFQAGFPFDYLGKTPDLEPLLLSYIDLYGYLELRNDPIHPRRGIFLGNRLQVAGGPFFGDATDLRDQPELKVYVPISKRLVLAMRTSVGFLFPLNYGDNAARHYAGDPNAPDINPNGVARDYQILFFRGFFSGGPTSNRGYPLRGIGPRDKVPYVSPAGQSSAVAGCDASTPACVLPTGGLSLWEANAELRFVITGPISTAGFCDASDVSAASLDIRLNHPHLSCGGGFRYDTPVGPIRLDAGVRIPGAQFPAGARGEAEPGLLFDTPMAISFGIGEAF